MKENKFLRKKLAEEIGVTTVEEIVFLEHELNRIARLHLQQIEDVGNLPSFKPILEAEKLTINFLRSELERKKNILKSASKTVKKLKYKIEAEDGSKFIIELDKPIQHYLKRFRAKTDGKEMKKEE